MKDNTALLFKKASRAIMAAKTLLADGDTEFAAGRAYYAMFYVAEALLNEKDLHYRKHGGVHGAFGEHFIKTGQLDARYHRWLLSAFNRRIVGDYGIETDFTYDEVQEMITQATEFLAEAQKYLGTK